MSKELETLKAVLGGESISYKPIFAKAIGSPVACILLSQMFFRQYNAQYKCTVQLQCKDGQIREFTKKTAQEWQKETGIPAEMMIAARRVLRDWGILIEQLHGIPATLHGHIDIEQLAKVVADYLKLDSVESLNQFTENPETGLLKTPKPYKAKPRNYYKERLESLKESIKDSITPNPLKGEKPIEQSEAFALNEEKTPVGYAPPVAAHPPAKKRAAQTAQERCAIPEKLAVCASFVENWSILLNTKKWAKKENNALSLSLKKLAVYPPEFAAHLCELAIEANYAAVVYDSAPAIFEKWKKTSGKAQSDADRYAPVDKIPTGDNSRYDLPQKIVAPVAKPFERPGRTILHHLNKQN